uniref:Uncharacterized protein n=1 Tax=Anguilla anguilla TaxID=7936 RepID=A0A0E9TXC5_ANGAN
MPVICDVISAHHYCKDWNQLKQPQPWSLVSSC